MISALRVQHRAHLPRGLPDRDLPFPSRSGALFLAFLYHPFPHPAIPCPPTIRKQRNLHAMGEYHRVDDLSAVEAPPAFEHQTTCIVPKIDERITNHASLATLASHGSSPFLVPIASSCDQAVAQDNSQPNPHGSGPTLDAGTLWDHLYPEFSWGSRHGTPLSVSMTMTILISKQVSLASL